MKKVAIVIGCLVLAGVGAVAVVDGYLRWQDPIGYRNLKSCSTIKPGASLAELKSILGEPVDRSTSRGATWFYFQTASIAAGPIRAAVHESSGKVLTLRRNEDGPDTWSLKD